MTPCSYRTDRILYHSERAMSQTARSSATFSGPRSFLSCSCSWSNASRSSWQSPRLMTSSLASSPCLRAFSRPAAFPASVFGRVERCALRRFASIFFAETAFAGGLQGLAGLGRRERHDLAALRVHVFGTHGLFLCLLRGADVGELRPGRTFGFVIRVLDVCPGPGRTPA